MKHLLTALFIVFISLSSVAQDTDGNDKEAAKAKKETYLLEVFKEIKATPEEQKKMREFITESGEYGKELRADPDFTDEEKKMKAKLYAKIKNARLRELLGDARYQQYKDIKNVQKARDKK